MIDEFLTTERAVELVQRQERLQTEAAMLLAELDLMALLAQAGRPVRVGSSVFGLMAWRDIDFNVMCDPLDAVRAMACLQPLAGNPRVWKLRFTNETGAFNRTGQPQDEGYYWGINVRDALDQVWKLDVWFLPDDAPRPEIVLLQTLPPRLTPEIRQAILWIKDLWHTRPEYRTTVLSVDIYNAVLEHGVRTPAAFEAYLRAR